MAPRSSLALALAMLGLMTVTCLPLNTGLAQETEGRWAFGIRAGANLWYNGYNKRVIGEGGELITRYGFTRSLSAGLRLGYEELKSNQDPPSGGVGYMKLWAIPASLVGWVHLAPESKFNPYLYAGVGTMIYLRMINGYTKDADGFFKSSLLVPFGAGFESPLSKNLSFVFDVGYTLQDDRTDANAAGHIHGYAAAKAGVNIYFGTSNSEMEELAREEARREKENRDAIVAAEAARLKDLREVEDRRAKEAKELEARQSALPEGEVIPPSVAVEVRKVSAPIDSLGVVPYPRFTVRIGSFINDIFAEQAVALARERFHVAVTKDYSREKDLYFVHAGQFRTRQEAQEFKLGVNRDYPKEYGDAEIIRQTR